MHLIQTGINDKTGIVTLVAENIGIGREFYISETMNHF